MKDTPLLELKKVSSGYKRKLVVRDIDLQVEQGKIVSILGANGVGKSTIMRTIMGQIAPSAGQLFFDGQSISGLSPHRVADLGVGYCPEGRRIFGNLTVKENLVVGSYRLKTRQVFRESLSKIYTLFPRLQERSHQLAETMSGGEQQMLAIARALISQPKLLLLDEPSLGLAPVVVQLIADTLLQINREEVSVFLVEQNASIAMEISDYSYLMDIGGIVHHGTPRQLLEDRNIADIYLGFD
jgi:branched-chain amino acid transport system ATP-binding protein